MVLTLPYRMAFVETEDRVSAAFDFLVDVFFLFDIGLNFRTAYYVDSELHASPRDIARYALRTSQVGSTNFPGSAFHSRVCTCIIACVACASDPLLRNYARTWLCIDVLSSTPLDWFTEEGPSLFNDLVRRLSLCTRRSSWWVRIGPHIEPHIEGDLFCVSQGSGAAGGSSVTQFTTLLRVFKVRLHPDTVGRALLVIACISADS